MRGGAAPLLLLLLPATALIVLFGGERGALVAALGAGFLVLLALLLFRGAVHRTPGFGGTSAGERTAGDAQFLGYVVLGGLFARVVGALLLRQFGLNEVIAPDEYTFHDNGMYFLGWLEGTFAEPFSYRWINSTQTGYFVVVGTLYAMFGVYPIVPVLVNCLVGALCAYPAYRLAARLGGRAAGRASAVIVTFFPSLILWSTLQVREAFALYLILWTAVKAEELLRRFSLRSLIWLLVCLGLLATLRTYLFLLLGAGTTLSFLVAGIRKPGRALAISVVGGLGVLLLVRGVGLGEEVVGQASLSNLAQQRVWNTLQGNTTIALEHDLSTPTGAIAYLPTGLAWFLLSPFPWQFGGRQALAIPDVLVWYALIPYVVRGVWYGLTRRRRSALVPVFSACLVAMLYALVAGNVGIIFRHRAQFLVLALPYAGVAWAVARRRKVAPSREWATPQRPRARTAVAGGV